MGTNTGEEMEISARSVDSSNRWSTMRLWGELVVLDDTSLRFRDEEEEAEGGMLAGPSLGKPASEKKVQFD